MVSAISSGFSMPDWSTPTSASADLNDFFSSAVSGFTSTLTTATTNQLNGLVNNAADAAAKRLGVSIPSSSSSSKSTSATSSSSTASSKSSSKTKSSSGPSIASKNIDQLLATLDGHPPAAATSSTSTGAKFNLNSFLGGLDKITTGNALSKVPATPTGKNFSINSYLATLDNITSRPPTFVNVSA